MHGLSNLLAREVTRAREVSKRAEVSESDFEFLVCEVGFNMGHSVRFWKGVCRSPMRRPKSPQPCQTQALNWLLTDPKVKVLAFDLGSVSWEVAVRATPDAKAGRLQGRRRFGAGVALTAPPRSHSASTHTHDRPRHICALCLGRNGFRSCWATALLQCLR